MKQLVIMPGGFHPFHAGHLALYQSALAAFPGADVKVAATNDTSARPFPFKLKEKLAQLAGVPPGDFYQVKSPFQALEITQKYNPADTQLIFVRSEKDADKPPLPGKIKKDGTPGYLQPISDQMAPMTQHAYMAYLPTVEFGPGMTSATQIRTAWPSLNERQRTALVMSLYPNTQKNTKLANTVVKMLDTAMGVQVAEATGDERFDSIMSRIRQEPTIPMYQSIKDEITEAFDYPYKLKWEKSSYGDVDASATLDDGNYLNISFNPDENQDGKLVWNVEFDRNYSQAVTGEGDAQRVFATVLSAIQIFIKKYKPLKLAFGASKEVDRGQNSQSRARLYDSLVQRYARAWGYRVFRADTGNLVIYEFSRIQKPKAVGEDYNNRFAKQGVAEGLAEINWVKPNFDFEWHEVEEQSKMEQVPIEVRKYYQKHFPNKEAWLKSVQNGKVVVVNPDHKVEIRNAPHDKQSLMQVLAPTGHEGPIGPAKEKRVNDLFDKGQVEMPIILKTSQGLWLIGGKTRLGTANYVKGLPAKVWLIGGKQGVDEEVTRQMSQGGLRASYQNKYNQPMFEDYLDEARS
jgi:hypothetical protein